MMTGRKLIAAMVYSFCIIVLVLGGLVLFVELSICKAKWEGSGFDYEYGIWSGCRIKVDDKWLPEKNYRKF
jgi:hypothetical protein